MAIFIKNFYHTKGRLSLTYFRNASLIIMFAMLITAPTYGNDIDASFCASFVNTDLSETAEAPTHIIQSSWIEEGEGQNGHCKIDGYTASDISISMLLPRKDEWNGKFSMYGCGGFCGSVFITGCNQFLERGYACIASDMGHRSTALDGKWAYNNRDAEINFGFRATHATAVAGKAITEKFYGKQHSHAYYLGCSTGGRQGMLTAQSFPYDFDGIVSGAPVINETLATIRVLWSVVSNFDDYGNAIMSAEKLPALHDAVLAKCDAKDGLKDGLISEPYTCDFDPIEIQCNDGENSNSCLTPAEVEVVRNIYQGPVDKNGQHINVGGPVRGSELNWAPYLGSLDNLSIYGKFMENYFSYMASDYDPGSSWSMEDFKFSHNVDEYGVMERLYNAGNPDLRRFKNRGGKLIMYHGLADQSVIPTSSIDYYEMATKTMGGADAINEFYRLFLMPGVNHCRGGVGPDTIDYISAIENWVENGNAPDELLAKHIEEGEVTFERPLYPYPIKTKYNGSGDPTKASSFSPGE